MKKYYYLIAYSFLILLIGVLFLVGQVTQNHSLRLSFNEANTMNEGWRYSIEEGSFESLETLPTNLSLKPNESYTIQRTLDVDFLQAQTLLIRTSLSNVIVRLDDVILYEVSFEEKSTYASTWHLVEVPQDSEGKNLEIIFSTPFSAMSGILNEVYYGDASSLYMTIFNTFGFRLIIGLVALFIGVAIMGFSLMFLRKETQDTSYLGLFVVLFSFWLLSESRHLQFILGNTFILGSLSYLALALFPIPLMVYLKKAIVIEYQKVFTYLIGLYVFVFISIITLHFTGLFAFFESTSISILVLVFTIVISLSILIIEYKKFHQKKTIKLLQLLIIIAVFTILEVITYFMSDFRRTSDFALIGFGVILLIVFIGFIKFITKTYKISLETAMYERLAYTDQLTGSLNRFAYFRDLKNIEVKAKIDTQRIVYFDLDNLKTINDTLGHPTGDEAIIAAYNIIYQHFGELGLCYRMGGDEFSCILSDLDELKYEKLKEDFIRSTTRFNESVKYHFRISIGSAHYNSKEDVNLNDTLRRSDASMYLNKNLNRPIKKKNQRQ